MCIGFVLGFGSGVMRHEVTDHAHLFTRAKHHDVAACVMVGPGL